MSIPTALLQTTCNVYRPFGAGAPTHTNVPCRLVPDLARGRTPNGTSLSWTHYLVLDVTADVLDAVTRPAGSQLLTYSDGDEIRVPSGATTPSFAVVWVETVDAGSPREYKRAYLMRHAA